MKIVRVIAVLTLVAACSICFGQDDTNAPAQPPATNAPTDAPPLPTIDSSELTAYKAKLYHAIEVRWKEKVAEESLIIPAGKVRIQYTVLADGTITTKVLDPGTDSEIVLLNVSVRSIEEVSPFFPFSDAVRKETGGSYTDTFVFKTK